MSDYDEDNDSLESVGSWTSQDSETKWEKSSEEEWWRFLQQYQGTIKLGIANKDPFDGCVADYAAFRHFGGPPTSTLWCRVKDQGNAMYKRHHLDLAALLYEDALLVALEGMAQYPMKAIRAAMNPAQRFQPGPANKFPHLSALRRVCENDHLCRFIASFVGPVSATPSPFSLPFSETANGLCQNGERIYKNPFMPNKAAAICSFNLSAVYLDLGIEAGPFMIEEALKYAKQAAGFMPDYVKARQRVMKCMRLLGKHDEAAEGQKCLDACKFALVMPNVLFFLFLCLFFFFFFLFSSSSFFLLLLPFS
jgi:hypothetical protein